MKFNIVRFVMMMIIGTLVVTLFTTITGTYGQTSATNVKLLNEECIKKDPNSVWGNGVPPSLSKTCFTKTTAVTTASAATTVKPRVGFTGCICKPGFVRRGPGSRLAAEVKCVNQATECAAIVEAYTKSLNKNATTPPTNKKANK